MSVTPLPLQDGDIADRLRAALGPDAVKTDADSLELYGGDIMSPLQTPVAIVRPADAAALEKAVATLYEAGVPIAVRGGGASYTNAYTPSEAGAVVIDMGALDRIIEIDAENLTAKVEPGVTWKALDEALKPHGLRAPFWGSYSGLHATVGGSISQHAISLGSGVYGPSNEGVTGLEVIVADGRVIDTAGAQSFQKSYGPDMGGLFCGDCGVFGVKRSITLRLMKRPAFSAGGSFAFPDFTSMAHAMKDIGARMLAAEIVAIDPVLQQGQLGQASAKDMMSTAKALFSSAPGPISGLGALMKAGLGARGFLKADHYAVHYLCEGHSHGEARSKLAAIRKIAMDGGAAEIANVVPVMLHETPFMPFRPVLGPKGERWLPLHCVLPYREVQPFHEALTAYYAAQKHEMDRRGVFIGTMFLTVGANAFVYEPTLYWRDSQRAIHKHFVPDEALPSIPVHEDDEETRRYAFQMKADIIGLMHDHGAAHYQIGRSYPYYASRDAGLQGLLGDFKAAVDPKGLFNPGALELPVGQ